MSYIIPFTFFSVIVLLLTTVKKTVVAIPADKSGKNHSRNGKERTVARLSIDAASFSNIVQQIVIVFLSALLAMSLTEYVETKMSRDQAAAFIPQMQNAIVSQFSKTGGEVKDIHDALPEGEIATDEQLMQVAKIISDDDGALIEAMLYNENVVSTVSPLSYMFLNMDVSEMKKCALNLSEIEPSSFDRQETAELIAEYLYCCTDAAFSMEILKDDVTYNLVNLAMADRSYFDRSPYYELYNNYIVMLEKAFDVDLKEYEGKLRYNNGASE